MKINCTGSGAGIPVEDVNLDRLVAKCRKCNCVFDFSEQIGSATGTIGTTKARRRAFVGLPARMKVIVDQREIGNADDYRHAAASRRGDFVVRRRWFDPSTHIFMGFFCVFWDGFLVVWYSMVTTGLHGAPSGFGLLFFLFPLIHVSVGVGLTYALVAAIFNTTEVGVRGETFFVRHGPIPWRGNRVLPARSITQFFCEEKLTTSKNGVSRTYNLSAILEGGERVRLVSNLSEVEQVLFLEHALEDRLGIVDVAVAGEVSI
jgi:hypothetical protein